MVVAVVVTVVVAVVVTVVVPIAVVVVVIVAGSVLVGAVLVVVTGSDSAHVLATFVINLVVPVFVALVVPVVVPVVVRHLVVPIRAVGISVVYLVDPDLCAVIAVEPVDRLTVLVVLLLVGSVLAVIDCVVDPLEGYLRAIAAEEGDPIASII